MKKLLFIFGIILFLGIFTPDFNAYASTLEDNNNIPYQDDDINDGINDMDTVNIRIKKISDFPNISPLGAGVWDYLGSSTFKSKSKVFKSGGGDLKIYITQPKYGIGSTRFMYKLMEEDTVLDDLVSSFYLDGPGVFEVKFNVRSFVDGDNNKAELYLKKNTALTASVISEWYD